MSTINEVRAADKKVRELLDALEKASMEEQGQLGIQLQQATDEYALAIRELPIWLLLDRIVPPIWSRHT